jgi:hypothetical protein
VLAVSDEQELAIAFAQMLLEPEAQRVLMQWGTVPAHEDLLAESAADPLVAPLVDTLRASRSSSELDEPLLHDAVSTMLMLTLSERAEPEVAAEAAQVQVESVPVPLDLEKLLAPVPSGGEEEAGEPETAEPGLAPSETPVEEQAVPPRQET